MTQRPEPLSLLEFGLHPAEHATLYLVIAGVCLLLALRCLANALAPIGPLVRAFSAAMMAVLAVGAALVFIVAAMVGGGAA